MTSTRRGSKSDFHWDGVITLHLLGGLSGRLRGDLEDHRRRIGIGLDVELRECNEPAADEHRQAQQNDRAPGESERQQTLEH
jgi:hypothetical protein